MSVKYLKWLNLLPLIMFFMVDKLRRGYQKDLECDWHNTLP